MTTTIEHTTMTREVCKACHTISPAGFAVPDSVWTAVVPEHLQDRVLCLACFARFGDERLIAWDRDIEIFPASLATHQGAACNSEDNKCGCGSVASYILSPDVDLREHNTPHG